MSEDSGRVPFVHELLGIGVWAVGVFGTFVWLNPAGTTVPYALFSLVVAMPVGFAFAAVVYIAMAIHLHVALGRRVSRTEPTLTALFITGGVTAILTFLLIDPARGIVESLQPGEIGDSPLRKGERAVLLLTAGVAGLVSEAVCLPVLQRLGIPPVRERPTKGKSWSDDRPEGTDLESQD
jgi:hypothetical protein